MPTWEEAEAEGLGHVTLETIGFDVGGSASGDRARRTLAPALLRACRLVTAALLGAAGRHGRDGDGAVHRDRVARGRSRAHRGAVRSRRAALDCRARPASTGRARRRPPPRTALRALRAPPRAAGRTLRAGAPSAHQRMPAARSAQARLVRSPGQHEPRPLLMTANN